MAKIGLFRVVNTGFWSDVKVSNMNQVDKLTFLYLLTNQYSNVSFCYELPLNLAYIETGFSCVEDLIVVLERLRDAWKVIDFDKESSEILVCNRGKYACKKTKNGKAMQCVDGERKDIKNERMKAYVNFLYSNEIDEDKWDNEICNYYDGTWEQFNTMSTPCPLVIDNSISNSISNSNEDLKNNVSEIIDYFNKVTGSAIRNKEGSKNSLYILNILKDGFTVDDCKLVIDKKNKEWSNNPDMSKYVRISTLFAKSHFEDYLNQRITYRNNNINNNRNKVQVNNDYVKNTENIKILEEYY